MKSPSSNIPNKLHFALLLAACAVSASPTNAAIALTSNSAASLFNGTFTLGYSFTVTESLDLNALGQFDVSGNGVDAAAKIAVFNWDSGAKLVETTLAGAVLEETGFYDTHFVSIPTLSLNPGTNYLVAVQVTPNDYAYGVGVMTFAPGFDWIAGRSTPVGSPAMPATATTTTFSIVRAVEADGSYFGPNMKFSPVPEPASAALLGLGGMGLFLRRRRA